MTDTLVFPLTVVTAPAPSRCAYWWHLSEQLRIRRARLAHAKGEETQAAFDDVESVKSEMDMHMRTCPACRAWWNSITSSITN